MSVIAYREGGAYIKGTIGLRISCGPPRCKWNFSVDGAQENHRSQPFRLGHVPLPAGILTGTQTRRMGRHRDRRLARWALRIAGASGGCTHAVDSADALPA